MASTVETTESRRWVSLLNILLARRAGLAIYQWLWIGLCVVIALAFAAPQILSQPVIYYANASTRFDMNRYGPIYQPVIGKRSGLDIAITDTQDALRQRFFARGDVRFGLPTYRIEFIGQEAGNILVRGIAATPAEAQQLADAGAEELARQVRAAGGREILRNMLGWDLYAVLQPQGAPASSAFDVQLRELIRLQAFPMSRPLEPVADARTLDKLSEEEISDLARAFEARIDLWRFAINTRNATLDAWCQTPRNLGTAERETFLTTCGTTNEAARLERTYRDDEIAKLRAVEAALRQLFAETNAIFQPDLPSAAYRIKADLPTQAEPRYIPQLFLLAIAIGLGLGVSGVAVDRSAGVLRKIRELWEYRELIRNLVLRDLRSRYKSSALGYLWTQIAPLMSMSIFVLVFSVLMPSGLALFPVFVIVSLLPWNYCAEAVLNGTRSILDNASLIKKVYFPREVLPVVSVFSSLVNYLLSLPMMFLVIAAVQLVVLGRISFSISFVYLPVLMLIQTVFLLGLAFLLSTVAVFFRDAVHLIGILINLWFFLTPVFYSLDSLQGGLSARVVRWINPMASLVEFYREIFYGNPVSIGQIPTPAIPALSSVLRVSVTALIIFVIGYWFFQRNSGRFGEEI